MDLRQPWDGGHPAVLQPPATALVLPRIAGQVPVELGVSHNRRATAELAAALLAEGVLRPEDWYEDLSASLHHGLVRWANVEMGGEHLQHLKLCLVFSDDGEQENDCGYGLGVNAYSWREKFDPERSGIHWQDQPPQPVGCFALTCGDAQFGGEYTTYGQEVVIGPRILQLESLCKGAGWSVYALLHDALRPIGCWTPTTACDFAEWCGFYEDDGADPEDEGEHVRMTNARLCAVFPEALHVAQWDPAPVRKALRRYDSGRVPKAAHYPDPALREVLALTLELGELANQVQARDTFNELGLLEGFGEHQETVAACLVHWS
ncbi:MAG TPA: hypothetical protein VFU47_00615, partial [Armatimonadota bacterium]|nr:hypothetical protein [Armatimonadota bacterium]